MAKSVSFVDIVAPSNLAGVAVAGGTLATNTTYYYIIQAVFSSGTDASSSFFGKSLASNEISINTSDTNKSVTLTWNHPKGIAGGYRVYRASTAGTYAGCINNGAGLRDSVINNNGICTFIDTGFALAGNIYFQNTSHGVLNLLSSAPLTDIWSIKDVYDLCVLAGYSNLIQKLDNSTFRIEPYLVCYSGIQWVDEEKTIIFADSINPGGGSNSFRFGRITGNATNRGCRIIFKTYWLASITFATLNCYKTTFDWILDFHPILNSYSGLSIVYINFSSGTIRDCQANKIRSFNPNSTLNCIITNFILTDYDIGFSEGKATFTNVTAMSGSRAYQTTVNSVMRAKNLVVTSSTYAVALAGKNAQITIVDTNVAASAYSTLNSINSGGSWVKEYFTYNLTVRKLGSAETIPGASVKIWDALNNLILDVSTNALGEIVETELIFRKHEFSDAAPSIRITTLLVPHKIIVTADGYEEYVGSNSYSICAPNYQQITLTPSRSYRTTLRGRRLKVVNPEKGSGSKLLEL